MEFILYAKATHTQNNSLQKKIVRATRQKPDLACDFDSLFKKVRLKISEHVVIIFLISSAEELDFLNSNRTRLFNSRLILILPGEEESLISKGLSLYPRYLSYASRDFKDVSAVLNKMIQYNASQEKRMQMLKFQDNKACIKTV